MKNFNYKTLYRVTITNVQDYIRMLKYQKVIIALNKIKHTKVGIVMFLLYEI